MDITERNPAEENLRLNEERYRSFIQNSQGVAFQIDKNFNLEFIHGAVKEITGYSEEELFLGTSWRQIVVSENIDVFLKAEQKAVMTFIFPRSRSTILRAFNKRMEQENVPSSENIRMVTL